MSHFTVLVKVTAEKLAEHGGNIKDAIDSMLAPYQENNMGDCPQEYLAFHDQTEEIEKRAKEIVEVDSYMGKQEPDWVGKTYSEAYGGIDEVAEGFFEYKKDEKTGKYGYWENPNRKWDWYQVGGRWSGMLRVKEMAETAERGEHSLLEMAGILAEGGKVVDEPHTADIATVADIDFEGMALEVDLKIEEFWGKYLKMRRGEIKGWDKFDIDRTLSDLGLVKVLKEAEEGIDAELEYLPFTLDDLKAKYRWPFEFGTWAVLDENGWHEKGNMGWFGMSDATHNDEKVWAQSYVDTFLKNEKLDTRLAIVDAHI